MFQLCLNGHWEAQVQHLREQVTEDTHLIRFDNGLYRICRDSDRRFEVQVLPASATGAMVRLAMQERDLYVSHIDGRPFENYAATLDQRQPGGISLEAALHDLHQGARGGRRQFEDQSLIVLCVAESLRDDHLATRIGQLLRGVTTPILGAARELPMAQLLAEARAWGQASEAIMGALSAQARSLVLQPRAKLTPAQRQFSERVDMKRIDALLHERVRAIKVIKRPNQRA